MKNISHFNLFDFRYKIISLLLGFFISTVLSTMPAQTGDWGIIGGSIIVTIYESISRLVYYKNNNNLKRYSITNHIKIGVIYGIFVDAFKLGS